MRKLIKGLIPLLVIVALTIAGALVVKKRKEEISQAPPPAIYPLPVRTAPARKGTLEVREEYLGRITPLVSSSLAPRVTGHILEVKVREGDRVKKGEVLARLDDRPFVNQYQSLKAQLEGAKSSLATLEGIYHRDLMLFKNKAISQEQLDKSRAARDEARARVVTLEESLKTAQLNMEYCTIKAPMNGVITRRLQDPGDLGIPGKAILEMEAPSKGYKVVVRVPQDLVKDLHPGGKAYLYPASDKKEHTIKASISRIYPAVTVGTLATVEIDLPRPPFGLPSGATVDVSLVTRVVEGMVVPTRALLHTTQGDVVFALTDQDRVEVVPVRVLAKTDTQAAVSATLSPGQKVVTGRDSALLRLHEGMKVKPVSGEGL